MNLRLNLYHNINYLVICQDISSSGVFSYLIIVFTKRKVGAYIAMPLKGNVHLLFHNV